MRKPFSIRFLGSLWKTLFKHAALETVLHVFRACAQKKSMMGRAWAKSAGKKYRYYMVFRDADPQTDGMISMSEFLEIIKVL